MMELVRTNNVVLISFIEALLRDSNIRFIVADQNMSIVEGSIGIFPRRVMVDAEDIDRAKKLLRDADLEHELKSS